MSLMELFQEDDTRESGRVDGVAIGLVTNNKDTQGLGRIKVKYPWRRAEPWSLRKSA